MASARPLEGQCQCGLVKYRITAPPLVLYTCHCLDCQKQSSSAFGMSLWVRRDALEFIGEAPKTWTTAGSSGAPKVCAFCGTCGTRLYHDSGKRGDTVSLKAGTLDDTASLRPIAHIWTKRTQAWFNLEPEKYLCFETEPESFDELLALWAERGEGP